MSNRRWWNEPGIYTVSAVPYSRKNGSGLPGTPLTVTFFIEDKPVTTSPLVKDTGENGQVEIFPVPALGQLNISMQGASSDESAHIIIWDMMGEIRFDAHIPVTQEPFIVDLERAGLQKGMHFIRIQRESNSEVLRFVKE